ncbi:hypothetical protein F52700_3827 [Fusarium sp. NRRL 52700]|nr:hypothetical protein F52700_3827 [Fusarium sp. NRRL 52700]
MLRTTTKLVPLLPYVPIFLRSFGRTPLGLDSAGPPFGTAEKDVIYTICGVEGLTGIYGALRPAELGVCMQCVLRTYTTHEMVFEVELANAGLVFLKSRQNQIDPSFSHGALSTFNLLTPKPGTAVATGKHENVASDHLESRL